MLNVSMAKKVMPRPKAPQRRRHFIKQWREYRGLTQERLAERTGMSNNNISQLENFKQNYSTEGLEAIANALRTEPGLLLMVDPTKEKAMWSIWEQATPAERTQIVAVAEAIIAKKTGTDR